MQVDLTERVALVTGSAHRVGKAIALELAKNGVNILVHYHSSEESTVRETTQEIKSYGVDAYAVQADVSTNEGVKTVFDAVKENYGKLDILVNSASIFSANTFMNVTLDDWNKSLSVNLTAPFLCMQAAARLMQDNSLEGGSIVNILDYGAVNPWPDRVDHNISKSGLYMLTKVGAMSLGEYNIRVNGVLPGPVMKDAGTSDEQWQQIGQRSPLGRTGNAGDVARTVVYLVSENYITGTVVKVNGGEDL
jgi:NAD(P)-dependent dehydrogenase (short-subunit alcohol dehydrogenase family)